MQTAASSGGRESPNHEPSVVPRATRPGAQAVLYLPSYPTEGGQEHHGTIADTVPHQGNTLQRVCLTGDKLQTSSSTSYLWTVNPLPSCRQNLSFPPCFGSSTSSTSATAPDTHTHTKDIWGKYLNRKLLML